MYKPAQKYFLKISFQQFRLSTTVISVIIYIIMFNLRYIAVNEIYFVISHLHDDI